MHINLINLDDKKSSSKKIKKLVLAIFLSGLKNLKYFNLYKL